MINESGGFGKLHNQNGGFGQKRGRAFSGARVLWYTGVSKKRVRPYAGRKHLVKKMLAAVLAALMLVLLCGCQSVTFGLLEAVLREKAAPPPTPVIEPWPEPEPAPEPAPNPEPGPKEDPPLVFTFGAAPFLEFGEEKKDIEYAGNMYNEIYNPGEALSSEEIASLSLSLRAKEGLSGELIDFLQEFCRGDKVFVEGRAVTVNGAEQPYRCLYVRVYYPDEYFENDAYRDIYNGDHDLVLFNCGPALIENGFDVLVYSMYDSEEMQIISITSQEDGSFWEQ